MNTVSKSGNQSTVAREKDISAGASFKLLNKKQAENKGTSYNK